MPDKRDMHKAKSHRNSRKNQANNHRGNANQSANQHADGREAGAGGMRPAGAARPGEPGTAATSTSSAVTATGAETNDAPVPLGKKNRSRR